MMPAIRHRSVRQIGALFLLALLCCPLALSGHRHQPGDLGASRTACAVCATTAHTPALNPPLIPAFALPLWGPTQMPPAVTPPAQVGTYTRAPRAPPASFATLVA